MSLTERGGNLEGTTLSIRALIAQRDRRMNGDNSAMDIRGCQEPCLMVSEQRCQYLAEQQARCETSDTFPLPVQEQRASLNRMRLMQHPLHYQ